VDLVIRRSWTTTTDLDRNLGPFLLRFAPLFTWATTFVLALYLGRRQANEAEAQDDDDGGNGFLWWDHAA
jgi:hypothetical protein